MYQVWYNIWPEILAGIYFLANWQFWDQSVNISSSKNLQCDVIYHYCEIIAFMCTKLAARHASQIISSSFQLYFINFLLTGQKLAHSPVKFLAHSISYFVMNIIMAKTGSTVKVNSAKWHIISIPPKYFSAKISGHAVNICLFTYYLYTDLQHLYYFALPSSSPMIVLWHDNACMYVLHSPLVYPLINFITLLL